MSKSVFNRPRHKIVHEGRIDVSGSMDADLSLPALDEHSCFAEKFLANADRWADESVFSRDVIDLAFMMESWGSDAAAQGHALACAAYGDLTADCAKRAARKLLDDTAYLKRCVESLRVTETGKLASGLRKISSGKWASRHAK